MLQHMACVQEVLRDRHAALQASADEHLRPLGCAVSRARGGYFVWVELPGTPSALAPLPAPSSTPTASYRPIALPLLGADGVGAAEVRDICRSRAEGERADFHGGWKFGDDLDHCLRLSASAYPDDEVAEVWRSASHACTVP